MKNCYDCKNMKATIPLSASISEGNLDKCTLDYKKATAQCSEGFLVTEAGKQKVMKSIFVKSAHNRSCYRIAEGCPKYTSMID